MFETKHSEPSIGKLESLSKLVKTFAESDSSAAEEEEEAEEEVVEEAGESEQPYQIMFQVLRTWAN